MRARRLLSALLFLLAGVTPAGAVNLSKIDRTLKDAPAFQSGSPKFCLLVFGPEARTRVWLVADGDVVHVHASPNGKSAAAWRQVKHSRYGTVIGDVWDEDGKTCHKGLAYYPDQSDRMLTVRV